MLYKELFEGYPMHTEFLLSENLTFLNNNFSTPLGFKGITYTYKCEKENSERTFEIFNSEADISHWGSLPAIGIPKDVINSDGNLDYTACLIGQCQSCKDFYVYHLIHVYTKLEDQTGGITGVTTLGEFMRKGYDQNTLDKPLKIYAQKAGMYPEQILDVDKRVTKYFDRESNNWYFKAISCHNKSFGIGSFAYFRRIIEKELLRIIEDIASLDVTNENLKKLVSEYKSNSKVHSIYDNIFELLPNSFRSLGDNPIKLLYSQTSDGLHDLSEEECLKRGASIDKVLKFVILRLYEEKNEIAEVRKAIQNLK